MDSPSTSPDTYNTGLSSSSLPGTTTTTTIQATHQVVPSCPNHETLDPKAGESSEIFCGLCLVRQETDNYCPDCEHSFCSDCINKHVASKIKEGKHIIYCPGMDCKAAIKLEACTPILPRPIAEKWNESLFEALMREQQWNLCPKCTSYVEKTRGAIFISAIAVEKNGQRTIVLVARKMKIKKKMTEYIVLWIIIIFCVVLIKQTAA
uniref:uncharacterized protein LOC105352227 n=1 Tax=Fragaria vesca subsp. vesca TaxID=101020 RepID=UPI0005C97156|nr:PREDICTED: uncharacterized protein LOC105352227 [Fragaria vesca subsp. vesca]